MELNEDLIRSWVEAWSWRIPRGSSPHRFTDNPQQWWSLTIWRRPDQVELQLDVSRLPPFTGPALQTYYRTIRYADLPLVADYVAMVASLNTELAELFQQAQLELPGLPIDIS